MKWILKFVTIIYIENWISIFGYHADTSWNSIKLYWIKQVLSVSTSMIFRTVEKNKNLRTVTDCSWTDNHDSVFSRCKSVLDFLNSPMNADIKHDTNASTLLIIVWENDWTT
jgi:hypothetical protein